MMSQERLEEIVTAAVAEGRNAAWVAARIGVPIERVQRMMHKVLGTDPAEANRKTLKSRQQEDRQTFGKSYTPLRLPGQLPSKGRRSRG